MARIRFFSRFGAPDDDAEDVTGDGAFLSLLTPGP
jgi:hypothetical protein